MRLTMPSEAAESPKPCQMTTGRRRRPSEDMADEVNVELELSSEIARTSADAGISGAGKANEEETRTSARGRKDSILAREGGRS